MLRIHMLALIAIGALGLVLGGCEQRTTIGVQPVEECDLVLETLDGMFVAQKAAPDRGEYLDKDFRILFTERDGKKLAISTGGRVYPELPLTEKFPYVFQEIRDLPSGDKEAYYHANLVPDFNAEELEKEKKTNKNLGWKLEGMLYIRVDSKRCRLKISDMYATYLEGKRVEDFNMGGQSSYVRSEEDRWGMVSCPPARHRDRPEENRQGELIAWDKANADPNRDQSYPRGRGGTLVPVGKPVYWAWIDSSMSTKNAPEGCELYFDVYYDDLPVETLAHQAVTPGAKWTYWQFEMTHEALEKPTFIEIHRHKVCGGVDTIIESVCNVVATEKPEGEAAPAEGGP